ncbi:MAG: high frequency lysogenization protein HflD [Cellvibrionaceae bacterium]|nr:high frequency lysogenization protein HflD [Cellvibrionaceae bacterium]
MSKPTEDQIIALAAIFQYVTQVEQLAKNGHIRNRDLEQAVNSLLCQNPTQVLDVYGDIANLHQGLQRLVAIFERKSDDHRDCMRYVMGVLHLQRHLEKRPDMLALIGERLTKSQAQVAIFSPSHENVSAALADSYTSTISQLGFRIQVTGEPTYLQQTRIANQIRTLLFSSIRSAVLWRQLGGSRFWLLWHRKAVKTQAQQLLKNSKNDLLH